MKKFLKYAFVLGVMYIMIVSFAEMQASATDIYRANQMRYQTAGNTFKKPATTKTTAANKKTTASTKTTTGTKTTTSAKTTSGTKSTATAKSQTTAKPVATAKPDKRVANYTGTTSDYKEKNFKWTSLDGKYNLTISLRMDYNVYTYYRSLDRYYDINDYDKYIDDLYSKQAVELIVSNLKDIQQQTGYTDGQIAREAINFVQSVIEYESDPDGRGMTEFPKYPLETLFDKAGDCEDSAMLMASIIDELGYGAVLVDLPGHMAIGIQGGDNIEGTYYNYNGKRYYYTETTGTGWKLGAMPEQYKDQKAVIYTF